MESFVGLLTGLISGVLTVPIVSLILNQLNLQTTNRKVLTAFVISFALGTGAYFFLGWYQEAVPPDTPQGYIDALWPVWTAAFTASQAALRIAKVAGWAS